MIHLVLGGARSGKSSFAESWLLSHKKTTDVAFTYVATAEGLDDEMQQRISLHQKQRSNQPWQLRECPLELANLLETFCKNEWVLVDCLTLWLSNQLMCALKLGKDKANIETFLSHQLDRLLEALVKCPATVVIVSNEVGSGIVPMGMESRIYTDYAGWLNQQVAKVAQQVTLVTAGLPLTLKNVGQPND